MEDPLNAVLHDVMYVPGLSGRLFLITRFARHGHYATIRSGSTTLYFSSQQSPVTLTSDGSQPMAADVTVVQDTSSQGHRIPANRSHDHSANKKRSGLELLHQRLGHWNAEHSLLPQSTGSGQIPWFVWDQRKNAIAVKFLLPVPLTETRRHTLGQIILVNMSLWIFCTHSSPWDSLETAHSTFP